ncbi:TPA: hypothetical protein JA361_02400 [Legionella pneumophila]|nr:hypothetical protein [Legionella pneumophila]HAT8182308.1 hypothetical protein [Legionella pneumophila]
MPPCNAYTLNCSWPSLLKLTEESILLFNEGLPGQGYIGILDTTSGNVHLLPAFNLDDGKKRENRFGKPFKVFIDSEKPFFVLRSNLHQQAATILGLSKLGGKSGKLMGFSLWKDRDGNITNFLNRSSTHNPFSVNYHPLYREFFCDRVSNHSAHILEFPTELPFEISQAIFDCVLLGLGLPREQIGNSPRVNPEIQQHFAVEYDYFGGDVSEKYYSQIEAERDGKEVRIAFEFLHDLIVGSRIKTISKFINHCPCILSERTPETRESSSSEEAETALTLAIYYRKYKVAKLFLDKGCNWQNDPVINLKLFTLLQTNIDLFPQESSDAREIMRLLMQKNQESIDEFFKSEVGNEIYAFATRYQKLNLLNNLNMNSGYYCLKQLINTLKSEQFKSEMLKDEKFWGISLVFYFIPSLQSSHSQKQRELEQIINKIPSEFNQFDVNNRSSNINSKPSV